MAAQTLGQLENARALALGDGRYYPTIIPGVLPIIGPHSQATLEIRRWGADFLAETFASPIWPADAKATAALTVLETLKEYLEAVPDRGVIKSAVQAAASVYPLVYRHTITDPNDSHHWQLMSAIKSNILSRMDSATPGVRICCVKFVQQVVLVQTPAVIDPRRPDHSDVSLALVPRDHPLMPYVNLEAEGHGLLDRLLDIIHGDHSDSLLVTAVLNSLGVLLARRPIAANKILNSVLNLNPLKLANSPMTPRNKVSMKSIERTTRALLMNILKRYQQEGRNQSENPNAARVQQFLERMHRMRQEVLEEANRKRPAPVEPTDGLDAAKRQRVAATVPAPAPVVPPLPPGPVSYRQLFTLDPTGNTAGFDVQMFKDPARLLSILVPVLQSVDETKLLNASNIVRSRYLALSQAPPSAPTVDDEDEYEPDFEPEDAEQIVNRLDGLPSTDFAPAPSAPLAPYKLPEAPPLTLPEVQKFGDMTVRRTFGMLGEVDEKVKGSKGGFNRLAASDYGRDAWITILARLATRASAGLDDPDDGIKDEYAVKEVKGNLSIRDTIRDGLYDYIIRDWKKRIDVAISWLNEEWYNDLLLAENPRPSKTCNGNGNLPLSKSNDKASYPRCALRLIDGILPYVQHSDKGLIRLYSELPALDTDILLRVKKMADDPERITLACQVLQYLYIYRPPVREGVVGVAVRLWRENERARVKAGGLLGGWRPEVLRELEGEGKDGEGGEVKGEEVAV